MFYLTFSFQAGLLAVTGMLFGIKAVDSMPTGQAVRYVERACDLSTANLVSPLGLNLLILLLCAILGFLTRHLPDNFNESWYIFITVVTTMFLWLAFAPVYMVSFYAQDKSAILALALILNASVILTCLFVPKLYAVYFVNEKDIKISSFDMHE